MNVQPEINKADELYHGESQNRSDVNQNGGCKILRALQSEIISQ